MTEAESFREAITASPRDLTPKSVYADWLAEHGREQMAGLFRSWTPWIVVTGLTFTSRDEAEDLYALLVGTDGAIVTLCTFRNVSCHVPLHAGVQLRDIDIFFDEPAIVPAP